MGAVKSQIFQVIVGDEFCKEADKIGQQYSDDCWSMARKTQEAIITLAMVKGAIIRGEINTPFAEYILAFGVMDVYPQMAARVGVSVRTLRHYHSVVISFSRKQAEKYKELPFSHFSFARSQGPQIAEKILALSLRQKDLNGFHAPSVEWLEANLYRVAGNPDILDEVEAIQDFDDVAMSLPAADFALPENNDPIPASVFYFLNSIQRLLDGLLKRVNKMEIEKDRKRDILAMIDMISDLADKLKEKPIDTEAVK